MSINPESLQGSENIDSIIQKQHNKRVDVRNLIETACCNKKPNQTEDKHVIDQFYEVNECSVFVFFLIKLARLILVGW